jgi:hypothetical protein
MQLQHTTRSRSLPAEHTRINMEPVYDAATHVTYSCYFQSQAGELSQVPGPGLGRVVGHEHQPFALHAHGVSLPAVNETSKLGAHQCAQHIQSFRDSVNDRVAPPDDTFAPYHIALALAHSSGSSASRRDAPSQSKMKQSTLFTSASLSCSDARCAARERAQRVS